MSRLVVCALVMEIGWLAVGAASPRLSESSGFTDALFAALPPIWGWADVLRRTQTPEGLSKVVLVSGLIAACLGYVAAIGVLALGNVRRPMLAIASATVLFSLTLIAMPGLLSTDMVMYAVYGRLAGVYGLSPYLATPSSMGADPLLAWAARTPEYATYATPYGPLWTLLSAALSVVTASGSLLGQTFPYRLIGMGAHMVNAFLVWQLTPHVAPRADRTLAVLLYAWSPLVLFEVVGSGHNDGVMLTLTLLGLLLAFAGSHRLLGIGTIWLGTLVKWMPAVPTLYLAAGWVRSSPRASRLVAPLIVIAVLSALLFAPWLSFSDLPLLRSSLAAGGQRYVNALLDLPTPWIAAHVVDRAGIDLGGSQAVVRAWLFGLARLAVVLYVLVELRRITDEPRHIVEATVRTLLVGLFVAATQVLAWYLTWPLALAAPLGARSRLALLAVAYSVLYLPIFYAIHEDMLSTPLVPPLLISFAVGPLLAALLLGRRGAGRPFAVPSGQAAA